jgi:DNA-binding MarR family transcriptional regulator
MATATKQTTSQALPACGVDLSDNELNAWRGLLRAHAALVKRLDAELEAAHGLPLSSYEVLLFLDSSDGKRMRMHDLAESALLSRSGLTRLIDRLEREQLVARVSCKTDARGAFAELTPAGARKLAAARETHLAGIREHYLEHFDEAELELLGGFFERVVPGSATAPGCGVGETPDPVAQRTV